MNVDPNVVDMIGKILAVNAVAVLLLAVLSYTLSGLMLNGLAKLDRWLDASQNDNHAGKEEPRVGPM